MNENQEVEEGTLKPTRVIRLSEMRQCIPIQIVLVKNNETNYTLKHPEN